MILLGDYHTHSKLSDGKNTIEQNVIAARAKGLKEIAVTEHGYSHMAFGIKRKQYPLIKAEVDRLNAKYPDIRVYMGIESNIMSLDGDIDVRDDERGNFDVIVVGYHKTYKPLGIRNFFNFFIPNTLRCTFNRAKQIEKNTQAYINAIEKHKIDIIAHLNANGCKVNCVEIAKAAAKKGVYIELNGKNLAFSDKEMLEMAKTGVKFIVDSDAHRDYKVGLNNKALAIIDRLNIDHDQVANLDKVAEFKYIRENK